MDTFQKEVVVERAPEGSTNTVLIVIVLLILVALGVWWFTSHRGVEGTTQTSPDSVNVDVNLPAGTGSTGGTGTGGTGTGGTTYP